MARPLRVHFTGAVFRIAATGVGGQELFRDAFDFCAFLNHLSDVKERHPFRLKAYCLLPDRLEMLIGVQAHDAAMIMHRLLLPYAKYFNQRHGWKGHVFEKRHSEELCVQYAQYQAAIRDIHTLPVRHGLARDPADWLWSGQREQAGIRPRRLLDQALPLEAFRSETLDAYVRFVKKFASINPRLRGLVGTRA